MIRTCDAVGLLTTAWQPASSSDSGTSIKVKTTLQGLEPRLVFMAGEEIGDMHLTDTAI